MSDTFSVRIGVRGYELDILGHVNNAVYQQYAEHARWECLRAAGISMDDLMARGVVPVTLETTIRYRRELRAGDEVDVTCVMEWGAGKTFGVRQEIRRTDGVVAAEVTGLGGMMDLKERRLVAEPGEHWRALAAKPELLGL